MEHHAVAITVRVLDRSQLCRFRIKLVIGDYEPMRSRNDIAIYKTVCAGDALLVALDAVHQPRKFEWEGKRTLLSTDLDEEDYKTEGPILLRPDDGNTDKRRS